MPNFDAVNDIEDLNNFIYEVKKVINPEFVGSVLPPPPPSVIRIFPEAVTVWYLFSDVAEGNAYCGCRRDLRVNPATRALEER